MKFIHPMLQMINDLCAFVIFHRKKIQVKMKKFELICFCITMVSLFANPSAQSSPDRGCIQI